MSQESGILSSAFVTFPIEVLYMFFVAKYYFYNLDVWIKTMWFRTFKKLIQCGLELWISFLKNRIIVMKNEYITFRI